jgi:hypothetical protein
MANGGKDVKLGDDKRPVSIIPKNEDLLYNIANGEILTDEFGTPLITKIDQFFTADATSERSTSIVLPKDNEDAYTRLAFSTIGLSTSTYNINFDVSISAATVLQSGGSTVAFGQTVSRVSGGSIDIGLGNTQFSQYPFVDVKTVSDQGGPKNKLYFSDDVGISTVLSVQVFDRVQGLGIPDGTFVSKVFNSRIDLSNDVDITGIQTSLIGINRAVKQVNTSNNVLRVVEQFKESSEVSTTLLGVNRAETQLSLFSNVSSYGLNNDEFEFYAITGGTSFGSWDGRANAIYGNRYNASRKEEVQESAIRLEAFSVPYSYPFGPRFEQVGFYNEDLFNRYLKFIQLGNELFNYYSSGPGASEGYPTDWKDKFLNPAITYVSSGDVVYAAGIRESFAAVDTWTDTWRDIRDSILIDPITSKSYTFATINGLDLSSGPFGSDDTRPGYSDSNKRYSYLQSRRVFRYQPGRISGFTFGLRSSVETVSGVTLEWGIKNPTDQYVFQIEAGQLKIIRRSTIPLPLSALKRSGLTSLDQVRKTTGDPFDSQEYWTIEVPRDKFNGDPLNGNGPSGYLIQPNKVTMYKIEFGWYGAIGARFYAYIPAGPGEARWVVIHTFVIENSMGSPCLEDSYFRLVYSLDVAKTTDVRTPQFVYKYGASYYIDGGDEGTSQIFSSSSKVKSINSISNRTLLGVTPKNFILNSIGTEIKNKKLIIPTTMNITSDSLAKVEVVKCRACPGFGHVYTPGIAATTSGPSVEVQFTDSNTLSAVNDSYFQLSDLGSKLIAPSIWNAYISDLQDPVTGVGDTFLGYESAKIKGYPGANGYPTLAEREYNIQVRDAVSGIVTTINAGPGVSTYGYPIRLSSQNNHYAACDFKFTGSKIEIQFLNPSQNDSYSHFADFTIGMTNYQPSLSIPDQLLGFIKPGVGLTTVLKKDEVLYAEHTHSRAGQNEDGTEVNETWSSTNPPRRMALDYRIPSPPGNATGRCSLVTVEILDALEISGLNQTNFEPGNPPPNGTGPDPAGRFFLLKQGDLPSDIEFSGGQVKLTSEVSPSSATYVGEVKIYLDADNNLFSYIEISETLGSIGSDFSVDIRPIKITASANPIRQKLFNFDPYPLYFFAKLSDNAAINNISIKETSGKFQRTISPKLYTLGDNIEVTNAGGEADISGAAPTNFLEVTRLSSALIDKQNEQNLRPTTAIDTVYIGANQTDEIDMSKIFGPDRNVITPDNQNIESTFLVAKKLDSGASGEIEATLNYKEQ